MDPAMWQLYEDGDPEDELRVILRLSEGAQPPPEVRVVSQFGEIVTGRMERGDVPKVWYDERVESLKAPRKVWGSRAPEDLEPWSESDPEAPSLLRSEPGMHPAALGLP